MAEWKKSLHRLPQKHGWKCRPGYKIFVADRGAVRFDFPAGWIMEPGEDAFKFYDRQPPADNCLLQVSFLPLPPGIDWTELPLRALLEVAVEDGRPELLWRGEPVEVQRPDLELAWTEVAFMDEKEKREARSRICLARGSDIQPLITMDFWAGDTERFAPVWEAVLASLQLGVYVQDVSGPHPQ